MPLSDDELLALAAKHGIQTPKPKLSDDELVEVARKNGIGPDGNPLPAISIKNPAEVDWKSAVMDELSAPFTGTRAGRPVPDNVGADVASTGLISGAAGTSAATGAGLLAKVGQAAKVVKNNAVPLYAARELYREAKGLLGYGRH